MTNKIAKAENATTEVETQVGQALRALDAFNGRTVNGFGVYADVSRQHHELFKARDSILAALKVMSGTAWPTDADYDAADQDTTVR